MSFPKQASCEECECCGRSLAELGAAVQEFGEQNPLLCKQLGDAVAKLSEVQRNTAQQVQDRANRLKKVKCALSSACHVDLPKEKQRKCQRIGLVFLRYREKTGQTGRKSRHSKI